MIEEQTIVDAEGRTAATFPHGTLKAAVEIVDMRTRNNEIFHLRAVAVCRAADGRPLVYRTGDCEDHSLLILPAQSQHRDAVRLGEVPAAQYRRQTVFTGDAMHTLARCMDRGSRRIYVEGLERALRVPAHCEVRPGDWFLNEDCTDEFTRVPDLPAWPGPARADAWKEHKKELAQKLATAERTPIYDSSREVRLGTVTHFSSEVTRKDVDMLEDLREQAVTLTKKEWTALLSDGTDPQWRDTTNKVRQELSLPPLEEDTQKVVYDDVVDSLWAVENMLRASYSKPNLQQFPAQHAKWRIGNW